MNTTRLTIASYNLWFHKAYPELGPLIAQNGLDIVCLQECNPHERAERVKGLSLAGSASVLKKPAHGLAMYYDRKRLKLKSISSYALPLPLSERLSGLYGDRLQLARFTDRLTGKDMFVGNMHLSNLLAWNATRRKQAERAVAIINGLRGGLPAVVVGDYNYPVRERGLVGIFSRAGFAECGTGSSRRTHSNPIVRGRFDRIFISDGLQEHAYAVLPFGASDHAPVVAECLAG